MLPQILACALYVITLKLPVCVFYHKVWSSSPCDIDVTGGDRRAAPWGSTDASNKGGTSCDSIEGAAPAVNFARCCADSLA